MAAIRQSNVERRRGREECREKLSKHIRKPTQSNSKTWLTSPDDRLGIEIKPSEVRLNPRSNDPYRWEFLPGKEAFFSKVFAKNLSDHSISTYRLLCREVGETFEAVPNMQSLNLDSIVSVYNTIRPFHTVTNHLCSYRLQGPASGLCLTISGRKLRGSLRKFAN
ncbi:hypothetical protein VTK56DRAFT_4661 [Thermocarpiscus australiensis]